LPDDLDNQCEVDAAAGEGRARRCGEAPRPQGPRLPLTFSGRSRPDRAPRDSDGVQSGSVRV